tara:strand:- start:56 stop:265 length:210 start_codon:yes stop_codon:yes gene_type:complete
MKDKIREICYDLEIGCIDWTEASEQLLVLCDVSQQRELLIAYLTTKTHKGLYFTQETAEKAVDEYLSNL